MNRREAMETLIVGGLTAAFADVVPGREANAQGTRSEVHLPRRLCQPIVALTR
jgi:hypothetical protein